MELVYMSMKVYRTENSIGCVIWKISGIFYEAVGVLILRSLTCVLLSAASHNKNILQLSSLSKQNNLVF